MLPRCLNLCPQERVEVATSAYSLGQARKTTLFLYNHIHDVAGSFLDVHEAAAVDSELNNGSVGIPHAVIEVRGVVHIDEYRLSVFAGKFKPHFILLHGCCISAIAPGKTSLLSGSAEASGD